MKIIDTVKNISKKGFKVIETDRRGGDQPVIISNCHKAKEILGWNPPYGDIETIVETAWRRHSKLVS